MKQIPYATQWIDQDDIQAVVEVLKSSNLTQGPVVQAFEKKIAEYCQVKYAVAVNSGTSALHIACLAAGIKGGDEVITSANTFAASANCVLYCGGRPVFADIDKDTAIISVAEIKEKVTKKTKAIIPVHYGGHPADMEEIYSIARENDLLIIEDAAHALGARYRLKGLRGSSGGDWIKVGSCRHCDMSILSFHPVKHITTGEGGMVLTNNANLYEKLVFYRSHGITRSPKYLKKNQGVWYYEMHQLGFNYRLTDIQSALGISQLKKLDSFVEKRRKIAEKYDRVFSAVKEVRLLKEKEGCFSSRHLYVILVKNRELVFNWLREEAGIIVNVHYYPVYLQPYYRMLGYRVGECPNAEDYYSKTISIPMYPKLSDEETDYVIDKVKVAVGA